MRSSTRFTSSRKMTASRIKSIRLATGLVQEDFARLVNARVRSIGEWESGRVTPNDEHETRLREIEQEIVAQRAKEPFEVD